MPKADLFGALSELRVALPVPGAFTAVTIPLGARDALISLDDTTASFRASATGVLPAGAGTFIPATGALFFRGTATSAVTVFLAASAATTAQVLYTTDV